MINDVILEMKNVSKEFPGVKALSNVSLKFFRGETHALVGENGAGKSTLIKILSGLYPLKGHSGQIFINGKEVNFHSIRDSVASGIAVIYQELELINELGIAENLFLGRLYKWAGIVNWDRVYFEAEKLMRHIGVSVDLSQKIKDIGVGQQQLVAIAKALSVDAGILILDEPTAALTETEVALLMKLLRHLKSQGVTCILITHKLNEVFEIADRVTVLRDGEWVGTVKTSELDENKIINMMAGRDLAQIYPTGESRIGGKVLELKNFTKWSTNKKDAAILKNINLHVRSGEILGISGLMGAGRTELLMSIIGYLKGASEGSILFNEKQVIINRPGDAISLGIGTVTEDRKRLGLILIENVARNATLASSDEVSLRGILSSAKENHITNQFVSKLAIKTSSVKTKVSTLSCGNQQKV